MSYALNRDQYRRVEYNDSPEQLQECGRLAKILESKRTRHDGTPRNMGLECTELLFNLLDDGDTDNAWLSFQIMKGFIGLALANPDFIASHGADADQRKETIESIMRMQEFFERLMNDWEAIQDELYHYALTQYPHHANVEWLAKAIDRENPAAVKKAA